jgi:hypothetical protein
LEGPKTHWWTGWLGRRNSSNKSTKQIRLIKPMAISLLVKENLRLGAFPPAKSTAPGLAVELGI